MEEERFEIIYKQEFKDCTLKIFKDRETGLEYLWTKGGFAGGLALLKGKQEKTK